MFGTDKPQSQALGDPNLLAVSGTLTILLSQDFEAGDVVIHMKDLTVGPKSYATVQCGPGPDDHAMPSGDLRYRAHALLDRFDKLQICAHMPMLATFRTITVNHSCDPNVALDLRSPDRAKWHIVALKRIAVGDPG